MVVLGPPEVENERMMYGMRQMGLCWCPGQVWAEYEKRTVDWYAMMGAILKINVGNQSEQGH